MRSITLVAPQDLANVVVTVGAFDGIHVGHAAVLETVREEARVRGGTSVVVTFSPHPRKVIEGAAAPPLLTSSEEKAWRIQALGIDVLAVVPFTEAVRRLSPEAFVRSYLVEKLKAQTVIVGYDHGFGKDRSGGFETMQRLGGCYGFEVRSVPPTLVDGAPVSSTRVRSLVQEGDFDSLYPLLGGGYPIIGSVVKGDRRGRTLGFPTANLAFDAREKLLPPAGVYAAWVFLPEPHRAVLNFGLRPTFNGLSKTFEVHVLDFEGDLYGRTLKLEVCHRIRAEAKFESLDALTRQIQTDIQTARQVLSQKYTTFLRR